MEHSNIVRELMTVIQSRRKLSSDESYTAKLLGAGLEKITRKVREESLELIEAAFETDAQSHQHVVNEAADVVYHMLVLLAAREIEWTEVEAELQRRFGISGLTEKAARVKNQNVTEEEELE
jgi:phosphoribosyl-ATP pyrophosphohydrolase